MGRRAAVDPKVVADRKVVADPKAAADRKAAVARPAVAPRAVCLMLVAVALPVVLADIPLRVVARAVAAAVE